ncbi:D-hexose-6-phosphate mutarotase [Sulfurimonas aquatica]|uniref:Putative glucose-6-phosphate 1-epimerase n=1 Tax=Sulfurimonas aquatica TaxID=2672570 RepID=A0A975B2H6_9BACT|nr:D-hexose-6-phosphate mutarotase [Sulfurimonas aquatica]
MEYVEIKNSSASAKIALQGAHIFEFKTRDKDELLWLSGESDFLLGKAIRGGIPLCWPRFGNLDKNMPQHGFAREAIFELVDIKELNENLTEVLFKLKESKESRKIWDYKFELEVKFSISDILEIELKTRNCDSKEFMITQAFHTYFKISNISNISINNLDKKYYLDTLDDKVKVQNREITIEQEVDRVYQGVENDIVLKDLDRTINIKSSGSKSVIVWNPWIEKSASMSGMSSEAYKEFVCIESANAFEDFVTLLPGESTELKVSYSQED